MQQHMKKFNNYNKKAKVSRNASWPLHEMKWFINLFFFIAAKRNVGLGPMFMFI